MNSNSYILAVDIGNTRVKFATLENGNITMVRAIPSKPHVNKEDLIKLTKLLYNNNYNAILISSVVPFNSDIVKKFLKDKFLCPVYLLDRSINLVVKEKYGCGKAGMDIICKSAYLASKKQEFLCIDSGTATVINYVSKEGYLEKVGITIGFRGMYRGLHNDATLLPLYEPNKAQTLLNTNTQDAVNGGNYFGYVGLLNALIKEAVKETGCNNIYFTGGYSFLFKDVIEFPHIYDEHLLFKGMNLIYNINKNYFNNH